jgi:hypothetical protein
MDAVLKAAAINPNKESVEPGTDAGEPFRRGLGTVDAVLWRNAAQAKQAPAGGMRNGEFRLIGFFPRVVLSLVNFPNMRTDLTAQQLAALRAAAALRPGFAAPSNGARLSKTEMYVDVDGRKVHVRSVLATLCGRPRTSKDRVLRVQQQPLAISQPDEGADEPEEENV